MSTSYATSSGHPYSLKVAQTQDEIEACYDVRMEGETGHPDRQSVVLILLGQFSSSSRSAHTFMLQPVLSVTY